MSWILQNSTYPSPISVPLTHTPVLDEWDHQLAPAPRHVPDNRMHVKKY